MKCDECAKEPAVVLCTDCEQIMCSTCEQNLHRGGKRRSHLRVAACQLCGTCAAFECVDCSMKICSLCKANHSFHRTVHISVAKSVGLFFDVSLLTSQKFSVNEIVKEISDQVAKPKIVKIYTEGWAVDLIDYKAEIVDRCMMSPLEALILDVSFLANSGLTHVFIVTPRRLETWNRIVHLKIKNLKICVLKKTGPIKEFRVKRIEVERRRFSCQDGMEGLGQGDWRLGVGRRRGRRRGSEGGSWGFGGEEEGKRVEKGESEGVRCGRGFDKFDEIVRVLAAQANEGRISVERNELIEKISSILHLGLDESSNLLTCARDLHILTQTTIKLNEKTFIFFSLHIPQLTPQVLSWVLKSLKLDELSPTKHQISARLSKTFNLSLSRPTWKSIKSSLALHSRCSSSDNLKTSIHSSALLFKLRRYSGLDQVKSDVFKVRNLECWYEFIEFCENYFSNHFKQSIPMGRFGLITLIKQTGPESLRHLSSGKLIYLINLALKEELLQYRYPNIYWTKDFRILDNTLFSKLRTVKNCVVSLIAQQPVRLSCLKKCIKAKFAVDLDHRVFGFSKLKEMVLSIPELELSSGFVRIRHNSLLDSDSLASLINDIIKEKEYGITESVLQATLQARLSHSIDWTQYNVQSCTEFIKMFSRNEIEILMTYECNILFKSNEQKTYSYFFPFKSGFHSAVLESSRVTPQTYHPVSISVDFQSSTGEKVPMQRIIHISNIPSDMQKTPSRDEDDNKTLEPFIADLSNVSEIASSGFRSIQHSKNSSASYCHFRAQSTNMNQDMHHSRYNFSWIDKPFGLD